MAGRRMHRCDDVTVSSHDDVWRGELPWFAGYFTLAVGVGSLGGMVYVQVVWGIERENGGQAAVTPGRE